MLETEVTKGFLRNQPPVITFPVKFSEKKKKIRNITSFQNVVQTVNRVQMFRGVDGIDLCNE